MIDPHESSGIRHSRGFHCSKTHDARGVNHGVQGLGAVGEIGSEGVDTGRIFEVEKERLREAPRQAGCRIVRARCADNAFASAVAMRLPSAPLAPMSKTDFPLSSMRTG
jgi:hypothetical protein